MKTFCCMVLNINEISKDCILNSFRRYLRFGDQFILQKCISSIHIDNTS